MSKTVRDSRFRTRFNAVIQSLSREGKRVPGKLGDTLLLEASRQFDEQYRFRRDSLLVSALNDFSGFFRFRVKVKDCVFRACVDLLPSFDSDNPTRGGGGDVSVILIFARAFIKMA